jgi:hypothetical protein
MRHLQLALVLAAALSTSSHATCVTPGRLASIEEIVDRVHAENLKYVFVGEQHAVGPVKRFAVDLANALAATGDDVGLYVEGFRTDCRPDDQACPSLARLFNQPAFLTLLAESKAKVHAIDPVEDDARASRMAATISAGEEPIRVVLVGLVHVLHAGDDRANLWIYGGGMRYPDPGDLVESFPRRESLTVSLETADVEDGPYRLLHNGCGADYVLAAPATRDYWSHTVAAQAPAATATQPAGR